MRFYSVTLVIVMALCSLGWTLNFNPSAKISGDTLTFKVNTANCPDGLETLLDEAFDIWNGVPTAYIKVTRDGSTGATGAQVAAGSLTDFVIVCDRTYSTDTGSDPDFTLAVSISRSNDSGEILPSGIVINVQTNIYSDLTENQKIFTLTHEIGHILGLGHSSDPSAIMYYSVRGSGSKTNIAQDDVDGLSYLYPRNELTGHDGAGWFGCSTIRNQNGDGGNGNLPGGFIWAGLFVAVWVFMRSRRVETLVSLEK